MAGIVRNGTWYSGISTPATSSELGVVKPDGSTITVDSSGTLTASASAALAASGRNTYGTCSTAAATAAKVATISNTNWSLVVGAEVTIKFTNTNTAQNPTLNVNNTGAKSIWYNTSAVTTGSLWTAGQANRPMKFMYDGTYWVWMGHSIDIDSNTTYTPQTLGFGYGTCSTAAATAAKVATLANYNLVAGGFVAIRFTYAVPADATLNINSKGAKNIRCRNANITANVIRAGDLALFIYDGSYYHVIATDLTLSAGLLQG